MKMSKLFGAMVKRFKINRLLEFFQRADGMLEPTNEEKLFFPFVLGRQSFTGHFYFF